MALVLPEVVAVRQAHASTEDEAVQADIVSRLPTTDGMTMPVPLTLVDAARIESVTILGNDVSSVFYLDLRLAQQIEMAGKNIEVWFSATKLLDKAPPVTSSWNASGGFAKGNALRLNILFILADDLEYSDLSCYSSRNYSTPLLNRLASRATRAVRPSNGICRFNDR